MRKKRSPTRARGTSYEKPDLFSRQHEQVAHIDHSKEDPHQHSVSGSTTGPKSSKVDRLFVPLNSIPFDWFMSGKKKWELRRYGRQYNEKHVIRDRLVELRCGYRKGRALWGRIDDIVVANTTADFFATVDFHEVIPSATSAENAIQITEGFLGTSHKDSMIGFKVMTLAATALRLAPEYLELVRNGKKRTTIRRGRRKYETGPAIIVSGSNAIPITIVAVKSVQFLELTEDDAHSDGFDNLISLRAALHRFYPDLNEDDPVTIVAFTVNGLDQSKNSVPSETR